MNCSITIVYGFTGYFQGPQVKGMMNSNIIKTLFCELTLVNSQNVAATLTDAASNAHKELVDHPEFARDWPTPDRQMLERMLHVISHSIQII